MKKAKLKETKKENPKKEVEQQAETINAKSILITFGSIVVVFVLFYFMTDILVSKRTSSPSNVDSNVVEEEYISFPELLKQSEKEYYVFAIMDEKDKKYYETAAGFTGTSYYEIDMKKTVNKAHIGGKTSVGEAIKDIKISDTTLFVVKDKKIVEYKVGKENITKYLKEHYKNPKE